VAYVGAVALSRTQDPRKAEVAERAADGHCQAQVDVERHEDEHQRQTDPQLDEVQQRLKQMCWIQHPLPTARTMTTWTARAITAHDSVSS